MPRYTIRAWATQTLYDEREYQIDAATPEAAAAWLRENLDAADCGAADPWPVDADGIALRIPDPREIVDGENGYALLTGPHGAKVRDVEPDEAPAAEA